MSCIRCGEALEHELEYAGRMCPRCRIYAEHKLDQWLGEIASVADSRKSMVITPEGKTRIGELIGKLERVLEQGDYEYKLEIHDMRAFSRGVSVDIVVESFSVNNRDNEFVELAGTVDSFTSTALLDEKHRLNFVLNNVFAEA